jgi:hypothetical protein
LAANLLRLPKTEENVLKKWRNRCEVDHQAVY